MATTKDNLIETATKIFADKGFDGATTRMITSELGVSLSSIPFHFGTKENLYKAVLDKIMSETLDYFNPIAEEVRNKLIENKLSKRQAKEYLNKLIEKEIDWSLTDSPEDIIKLFVREYNNPTEYGEIVFDNLYGNLIMLFTELVMITSEIDDREWTYIYMCSVLGGIVIFAEQRYFIEKAINQKSIRGVQGDRIRKILISKVTDSIKNASKIYQSL